MMSRRDASGYFAVLAAARLCFWVRTGLVILKIIIQRVNDVVL